MPRDKTELIRRIEALGKHEQLVLSLRFEQALNPAEIAAVLDITMDEVTATLRHVLDELMRPHT